MHLTNLSIVKISLSKHVCSFVSRELNENIVATVAGSLQLHQNCQNFDQESGLIKEKTRLLLL